MNKVIKAITNQLLEKVKEKIFFYIKEDKHVAAKESNKVLRVTIHVSLNFGEKVYKQYLI